MMHSNWLQVELKELLGWPQHEGIAWQFVKIKSKPAGSQGRQAKEKTKSKATKYANLKIPSVTQLIMSLRKKDEKEEYERLEESKSHTFGGETQAVYSFCLNIWKLEVTGTFSQLDLWRHIVRRTISFCNR